jgi:hypothetical protein
VTDLARIMQTIRAVLYAPDGQPPQPNDPARDCSIAKQWLKGGQSVERIVTAIEGFGSLRRRGALSWCSPNDKATLRALNLPINGGSSFFEACIAAGLKPTTRKSGMMDLGQIMRRAAANG